MDNFSRYLKAKAKYERNILKSKQKKNPRCVFCKRNVGMVFENNGTKYSAKCGDANTPCQEIKGVLPLVKNTMYIHERNNEELNRIVGEIKSLRLKILYYDEIDKEDVSKFESLKKEFIKRKTENEQLREVEEEFVVPQIEELRQELRETGSIKDKSKEEIAGILEKQQRLLTLYQSEKPTVYQLYDEPTRTKIEYDHRNNLVGANIVSPLLIHKGEIETSQVNDRV